MKTLWFTGMPCSGKTTLADAVREQLVWPTVRLDGDHVRAGLTFDCNFTAEGRFENIRRCAEMAKILNEQEILVLAAFVSPNPDYHALIREIIPQVDLIHVNTPAKICEQRDVKGMWDRARRGLIQGFTGYDSDYTAPIEPAITIDATLPIKECVEDIMNTCLTGVFQ